MSKKIRVGNGTIRTGKGRARPKKAYITGPRLSDTAPVRRVLEAKGVSTFSPDELNLPSQNLTQVMREAMEQADLVVALVDSTKESNLVFYELGVAQALRKPAVVLLTKDASPDTWVACGVPYFRFDPLKPTSLEFGIDQVLAVPHHGTKSRPAAEKQTHPIGEQADELLARLRKAGDRLAARDFEALIVDAIRASGVPIVSTSDQADKGIDLAVWSDDLSPWVGNPLLVELKVRPSGPADLSASAAVLTRALSSSGMLWGLLIYHGNAIDPSSVPVPPNVLSLRAETFINDLREVGFGDLVRRLRNQRVHGGS